MWRLATSLFRSVLKAIQQDPEVQRHIPSHPGFWGWLSKQFSRSEPYGLPLTVGVALVSSFLLFFLSVDEAVVTEPMAGKTAIGNPFFTDGKAIVASLNCRGGVAATPSVLATNPGLLSQETKATAPSCSMPGLISMLGCQTFRRDPALNPLIRKNPEMHLTKLVPQRMIRR